MEDTRWTTESTAIVYECPGFSVLQDSVTYPDGTKGSFDYVSEEDTVVILPFLTPDRLVVISEWRQAVDRWSMGFPAGTIEPEDDDLKIAARRELLEETGYEAGTLTHLTSMEPANGLFANQFHYFVANECEPTATQSLDHNETIDVEETSLDTLEETLLENEFIDGRSAYGLAMYLLMSDTTT